jgi:hypothetical protein
MEPINFSKPIEMNVHELPIELVRYIYDTGTYSKKRVLERRKRAIIIQNWYKKMIVKIGDSDEWDKSTALRTMNTDYDNNTLFGYPSFAMNKLSNISDKEDFCIDGGRANRTKAHGGRANRTKALKWIRENLSEAEIAYTGF